MLSQLSKGCVITASHSGAGKTLVTLGLLQALKRSGVDVGSAKVGPDYIDPGFHKRASGSDCVNLDLWAMGADYMLSLACKQAQDRDFLLVEGVMGLFDGADDGSGSTADVACELDLPLVMVVDARAQSHSAAAMLHGFKTYRSDVSLQGVIFNRVGSERHQKLLREAAKMVGVDVLGCLPRDDTLALPSRHLGLVQAEEHAAIAEILHRAADLVEAHIDLAVLLRLQGGGDFKRSDNIAKLPPLGQRIAISSDEAFSFAYPHLLKGWREAGAQIIPFSPLADQAPDPRADAVFLCGGYPELHAGRIAANENFIDGVRKLSDSALIYGECGGFMVLGDALIDADGQVHKMTGLLPATTSFAKPRRHLGYRELVHQSPLPWPSRLRGHEFHYSTLIEGTGDTPLFEACNASGEKLPAMGMHKGRVLGSYAHVISAAPGVVP